MEDFLLVSVPVLIAVLAVGITALVIGVQLARYKKRRHLLQHGDMAVARVVTISQTGTSVNDVPEMRLVVDVRGDQSSGPPKHCYQAARSFLALCFNIRFVLGDPLVCEPQCTGLS